MLAHILSSNYSTKTEDPSYALCLAPGFFRFYAHIGILQALEEAPENCLNVSHVTGCSAGALVGAFFAAGMKPSEMIGPVLSIDRKDVWDMGGVGGLLKGHLFEEILKKHLPVQMIEECKIPFAATSYDLFRMRTNSITSGSLARAARASCTFPGLFQPAVVDGYPQIDGGVWDSNGMFSLPDCAKTFAYKQRKQGEITVVTSAHTPAAEAEAAAAAEGPAATTVTTSESLRSPATSSSSDIDLEEIFPRNKLIVNVVFDSPDYSSLPESLKHCRLLTIVVENIPPVHPFSMATAGPEAYRVAKLAMKRALFGAHMQEVAMNHWVCYVDGDVVTNSYLHNTEKSFPRLVPAPSSSSLNTLTAATTAATAASLTSTSSSSSSSSSSDPSTLAQTTKTKSTSKKQSSEEESDEDKDAAAGSEEGRERASSLSAVASLSDLLPMPLSMPMPSFHLPSFAEMKMETLTKVPSFSFINGSYFFYQTVTNGMTAVTNKFQETIHSLQPSSSSAASPSVLPSASNPLATSPPSSSSLSLSMIDTAAKGKRAAHERESADSARPTASETTAETAEEEGGAEKQQRVKRRRSVATPVTEKKTRRHSTDNSQDTIKAKESSSSQQLMTMMMMMPDDEETAPRKSQRKRRASIM